MCSVHVALMQPSSLRLCLRDEQPTGYSEQSTNGRREIDAIDISYQIKS